MMEESVMIEFMDDGVVDCIVNIMWKFGEEIVKIACSCFTARRFYYPSVIYKENLLRK